MAPIQRNQQDQTGFCATLIKFVRFVYNQMQTVCRCHVLVLQGNILQCACVIWNSNKCFVAAVQTKQFSNDIPHITQQIFSYNLMQIYSKFRELMQPSKIKSEPRYTQKKTLKEDKLPEYNWRQEFKVKMRPFDLRHMKG